MRKIILIIGLMMVLLLPSVLALDTNYISSLYIEEGILLDGTLESTKIYNEDSLIIQEIYFKVGLQFYINISDVKGDIGYMRTSQKYESGSSHEVNIDVYNPNNDSWVNLDVLGNSVNLDDYVYDLRFLNQTDNIELRYSHSDDGVEGHEFHIDYLVVESSGEEVEDDSSILDLDLSDTFTIIILSILIIGAILAYFFVSVTLGGSIIFLMGLMFLFNAFNPLISFIIIVIGVMMIFIE